jgi:hypothetical protein
MLLGRLYLDAVDVNLLREVVKPVTDLEDFLLQQPAIQVGMSWGVPRFGHPEGEVWRHVVEVLENIERLRNISQQDRLDLRLVTLIHDTFKYAEDKSEPRDWSKHHGILARKFAEAFIQKQRVLDLIEWHDEAYYCWRLDVLYKRPSQSRQRFDRLLARFAGEFDFYHRFFVCDTMTGDKNPAPMKWISRQASDLISPSPLFV